MADQNLSTLHPFLKQQDTKVSSGGIVQNYSHDHGSGPVLCMVHGYPESSYMWRHVIPLVKDAISLFVPELPGYGFSSLPPSPDKRTVGNLLIEALQGVFGKTRPVVWCGHDRGGRIGHRLLVDNQASDNIQSAIILDIVPTLEQFRVFDKPGASVAYYHWPFLATDIAPAMIERMGGAYWCETNLARIKGGSEWGVQKFKENHAWDHYAHQFSNPECISGTCADYKSGAGEECERQEADQKAGEKVKVPLLVLYSARNLGQMHDVPKVWREWCGRDVELRCEAIGDGIGHFIPEEAPEVTAKHILSWLDQSRK